MTVLHDKLRAEGYIDAKDFATEMGVTPQTVRRWLHEGTIGEPVLVAERRNYWVESELKHRLKENYITKCAAQRVRNTGENWYAKRKAAA